MPDTGWCRVFSSSNAINKLDPSIIRSGKGSVSKANVTGFTVDTAPPDGDWLTDDFGCVLTDDVGNLLYE